MHPDGGLDRNPTALASLRRYVRPRAAVVRERCALCDADLASEHSHLIEPATRRLVCACEACAILFGGQAAGRYRRVPRRIEYLPDLRLSDASWDGLGIPIDLAFFLQSTPAEGIVAVYPSPAGATESLVSREAWAVIAADNPALLDLEPDVEALLVNRVRGRESYRVGIDVCYKLVGVIRTKWRGLSGGQDVWDELGRLFAGLKERSS